ncbi:MULTISPECIES: hypothetical protein [unclassified Streptomyces]|uniref:hypothetical protein n=1 Tax=unclassified Streptomyces TaxID=2593676 RepID=UPI0033CAC997
MMFDLRAEAEMRLHSDRTASELALKKQREEAGENNDVTETPPEADEVHATTETTATTDAETDE